jgi:hypothetical protein
MPAPRDHGHADASRGPAAAGLVMALDVHTGATHNGRLGPNRVYLYGVGSIIPTSACQADEIVVGIEIWHSVAHPTDEKVRASSCDGPDERSL